MQLRDHVDEFREENAEVLALHCEGSARGTRRLAQRMNLGYPLGNDDRLNVVGSYSVTSTYLIDAQGVVRARWFDRVHARVDGATILAALKEMNGSSEEEP
ncbi:MAG: redoxin domain-containing protein [Gemmatimonadetes bacterium]|nr:redoxin domain-containing protein [Gemmatimonadota bacterium]MBT6148841.1 redoxin domain-containing protein [Gemmatimonadota bacterium]MBT7864017.1 redoxin domain-containing protein [Gemmatimonadota bacterium]